MSTLRPPCTHAKAQRGDPLYSIYYITFSYIISNFRRATSARAAPRPGIPDRILYARSDYAVTCKLYFMKIYNINILIKRVTPLGAGWAQG